MDYASAPTSLVFPKILDALGCTVVGLNERIEESKMTVPLEAFQSEIDQLAAITATVRADFGVRLDVGGERMWLVDSTGRKLAGAETAAAFLELALRASDRSRQRTVAVMINQPEVFDTIGARHGAQIRRVGIDPQALMSAMADESVILALSGAGEFIIQLPQTN